MEEPAPSAPLPSRVFTTIFLVLLVLTLAMVVLAFPAGIYAVYHGGLSSSLGYGSLASTYLWIGPLPAFLPFAVQIGALFVLLSLVYAAMLAFGFLQSERPLRAVRSAYHTGIGSLLKSPLVVILVSIGFLNFSAIIIVALSQAALGSVGNPFSNVDLLLQFGALTFAPLREEVGFRVLLIGVVALILSLRRPTRDILNALWRPSVLFEGAMAGGALALIIWVATLGSSVTFGVCHVTCGSGGWAWAKLPEAIWGGLVLGYLYVKYGLHVAVLTHWGVDYLGSVYAYFGQSAYGIPANSATTAYIGQYLVDFDMVFLFGLASFILVVYVTVRKVAARRSLAGTGEFDKGPLAGVGVEP